ncbi:hypothetical protein OH77DRAFT_999452 [Trametes cingulata]|nr:hypothetical protein OH77DRAFT_999452 [Trametes cingulata]
MESPIAGCKVKALVGAHVFCHDTRYSRLVRASRERKEYLLHISGAPTVFFLAGDSQKTARSHSFPRAHLLHLSVCTPVGVSRIPCPHRHCHRCLKHHRVSGSPRSTSLYERRPTWPASTAFSREPSPWRIPPRLFISRLARPRPAARRLAAAPCPLSPSPLLASLANSPSQSRARRSTARPALASRVGSDDRGTAARARLSPRPATLRISPRTRARIGSRIVARKPSLPFLRCGSRTSEPLYVSARCAAACPAAACCSSRRSTGSSTMLGLLHLLDCC